MGFIVGIKGRCEIMEQAFNNMMYKTRDELQKELEEERRKALDWLQETDSWEEVSEKYWEEYGDTLGKNFFIDNLDDDELADFILDYFEEEIDGNN